MVVVGVVVAAVAAFVISSVYYSVATPVERRVLGAAIDRGRPQPWKVLTELLRTAVVAGVFAWIARAPSWRFCPAAWAWLRCSGWGSPRSC